MAQQPPISTVWSALVSNGWAATGIPYVDADNTPAIDLSNLFWDYTNKRLYISPNAYVGLSTFNIGKHGESYLVNSAIGVSSGKDTPGWIVSSSRGTALAPGASLSGDFLGKFSGWAASGTTTITLTEHAGIYCYAEGSTAGNLGGELHFVTKADAGSITDRLTLDRLGKLFPTTNGGASLGKNDFGFNSFYLNYTIAGTAGPQTINKPAGKVKISAAGSSVVLTNSLITANSIVIPVLETVDTTAKSVVATPGSGTCTFTLNAAATAEVTIGFVVIGTN